MKGKYSKEQNLVKVILTIVPFLILTLFGKISTAQLDATFSYIAPSCATANDGQLCCETITGGVPPYTCAIVPTVGTYNPVTDCFENMPSGLFNITITDSQNNTGSAIGYVGPSNVPGVTIDETIIPAACGGNTGSICCEVSGGSGSFTYIWYQDVGPVLLSTGTVTTGQTICINSLSAGDYTLILDDNNTICGEIFSFIVTESTLSASATINPATCDTPCNGTILVDLSQATLPASVSWSGTASGSVSGITSSEYLITGLCQGTYQIIVDDASSCSPVALSGQNVGLDNSDIIISGCNNPIWNPSHFYGQTDITLSGNLIIQPGACLEIADMTIRLKPGRYIRIMGTGSLTTTNTTYDAGCGDWWQGFEVGSLQPNTNPANRGYLNMSANCVITHANYAIINYHRNGSPAGNSSGGRIEVTDTHFIDNNHEIDLASYYPQGALTANNRGAQFENCTFDLYNYNIIPPNTTITQQSDGLIGHAMINLNSITDVHFNNCRAENFNASYLNLSNGQLYKQFLASSFASFLWDGCSSDGAICNSSFIRGYIDAMRCNGDLTIAVPNLTNVFVGPDVRNTTFECYRGIYTSSVSQVSITDNNFRIFNFPNAELPPNYFWAANIQYRAAIPHAINPTPNAGTSFLFAGNHIDFSLPIGGLGNLDPNLSTGILVYNAGEHDNYVIENNFVGCNRAGQFDDRNKGSDSSGLNDALGLHYECNTLESCRFDFVIRDPLGSEGDDAGVYGFQRRTFPTVQNFSAGNKFNNSTHASNNDDIAIGITSAIHRYGYNPVELNSNGISEMSPNIQILSLLALNVCSYDYQNWSADFVEQQQQALLNYENTKEIYLALRDGGNTELVKGQVENSSINNSLSLYNSLIELSPDLSEEVLLSLITKEDEFPSTLLTLVLAANPVVPKSAKLLAALESRDQPLSDYQMSIILQGMNEMRPLEVLEMEMQGYRMELEKSRNGMLHQLHVSNESGNHLQTILNSYNEDMFLSDCLSKADLLMRNGFFEEGMELLNEAPNNFHFDTEEKIGFDKYLQLLEVEHDILTRNGHVLTQQEISYLSRVYEEEPCGYGKRAYHLLVVFADYPDVEVECNFEEQPQPRGLFHRQASEEIITAYMSTYPNPVNGEVLLIKLNAEDFGCGIIKIFSYDGRLLHSESIQENQTEILLNTEILTSGLNQICLFSKEGVLLQSNQIIMN